MLAEILSSKIRAEIFRLLWDNDNVVLHMRDIERKSGFSIGTVQRELSKLLKLDLIKKMKDGNRIYYRANMEHPLYNDIVSIVQKTVGLATIIKQALSNITQIKYAFIFGSIASNKENSHSDIDLMVIGDIGLRQVVSVLSGIPEKTGREINPHVWSLMEFKDKIRLKDHFLTHVINSKLLFIIGKEDEFRRLFE
ncbi:MAG: nucleotidyltransferase domain-containing protein [Candidatus Cloacimonetes bacterium]|nr:nucleotidyltransferase domain-containing protein [Candidatus Cloacimonadota bacterium]